MKKLSTCILALVFAAGSSAALGAPDHGDRHGKGAKHHKGDKYYTVGPRQNIARLEHPRHKNKHARVHRDKHERKHAREHRRHKKAKEHRREHRKWRKHRWDHRYNRSFGYRYGHRYGHHRYDRHYDRGWRYDSWHHKPWKYKHRRWDRHYYGDYLGAALIGSALTYSFYHTHGAAVCDDRHDDRHDPHYREGGYGEVVGCHRIEQLSDGSEVRVDVPLSECR